MHSPFNKLMLWSVLARLMVSASAAPLSMTLEPVFNDRPLQLDSLRYKTGTGETVGFSRISLLLCNFALETDEGEWIELQNRNVFLDRGSRRLTAPLGTMPEGHFRSIRFSVGPDPETNHSDPAAYAADDPLNPILNNLHWDWNTGYIFLALEGRFQSEGQSHSGFVLHFANDWNRTRIILPLNVDGTKPTLLGIRLDLGTLFNSPNPISLTTDGSSTHSREADPLAASIKQNLLTAFSLKRIQVQEPAAYESKPIIPLYLPSGFDPYPFSMSAAFPVPALPRDNPLTKARVALGEKLFHDPALSSNGLISCASCHQSEHAFTDARPVALGIDNRAGTRNSMPIFNMAWKDAFFWDGRAASLRDQVIQPITNQLEMASSYRTVLEHLNENKSYGTLFARAFDPGEPTIQKMALALEAYVLTITSSNSKFDQARTGKAVLTKEEQRGMELFFTEYDPRTRQFGADCFHCHGGPLFSDQQFHNNGLEQGADSGRYAVTRKAGDRFKFSTPSLRNIARTAPYMHDGRFKTLEEVINHYTSPLVLSDTLDPNLAKHPKTGLQLSDADKSALVAFLKTLTDPQYIAE